MLERISTLTFDRDVERDILDKYRMGESLRSIAEYVKKSPAYVVDVLRCHGFYLYPIILSQQGDKVLLEDIAIELQSKVVCAIAGSQYNNIEFESTEQFALFNMQMYYLAAPLNGPIDGMPSVILLSDFTTVYTKILCTQITEYAESAGYVMLENSYRTALLYFEPYVKHVGGIINAAYAVISTCFDSALDVDKLLRYIRYIDNHDYELWVELLMDRFHLSCRYIRRIAPYFGYQFVREDDGVSTLQHVCPRPLPDWYPNAPLTKQRAFFEAVFFGRCVGRAVKMVDTEMCNNVTKYILESGKRRVLYSELKANVLHNYDLDGSEEFFTYEGFDEFSQVGIRDDSILVVPDHKGCVAAMLEEKMSVDKVAKLFAVDMDVLMHCVRKWKVLKDE